MESPLGRGKEDQFRNLFALCDIDGTGSLDREEFATLLLQCGPNWLGILSQEEEDEMVRKTDTKHTAAAC
jgi:Ca2+-binding EF-hand superfamily protein